MTTRTQMMWNFVTLSGEALIWRILGQFIVHSKGIPIVCPEVLPFTGWIWLNLILLHLLLHTLGRHNPTYQNIAEYIKHNSWRKKSQAGRKGSNAEVEHSNKTWSTGRLLQWMLLDQPSHTRRWLIFDSWIYQISQKKIWWKCQLPNSFKKSDLGFLFVCFLVLFLDFPVYSGSRNTNSFKKLWICIFSNKSSGWNKAPEWFSSSRCWK